MAASCVSVSLTAAGSFVAARSIDTIATRQTSRLSLVVPSLAVSRSAEKIFASGLFLTTLSSRVVRSAGIAARAADLEEAETAVDSTPSSPAPAAGTKLYVGNLPWAVHSQQLAEIFQEYGNVELVEVIYDRDTQKSRGFAFVTMSTNEDAQRAIDALDGSELDGRVIKVNFPQTTKDASRNDRYRNERTAPRERREGEGYSPRPGGSFNSAMKIFVGNLSWGVDDVALDELFSEYGKVVEAKVVHDKATGRSRGFGFVTMTKETEVASAIEALDGADFDGRTMRVNRAGDKPERSDSPSRGY
ncbi:hypothetical protein Mapa_004357 [Marchantia paleacea]|nr:hypothetical protein Mapa_004357 [Marchantia paleacea]